MHLPTTAAAGVLAGLPLLLAACGSNASATAQPASSAAGTAALAPVTTPLGSVLATSAGRVVYVLQKDGKDVSCDSACQAVWPPVHASAGGHPVYTFTGDSGSGQTHGEGIHSFGGVWYAVSPAGAPVLPASGTASSSSSGGGYGSGY